MCECNINRKASSPSDYISLYGSPASWISRPGKTRQYIKKKESFPPSLLWPGLRIDPWRCYNKRRSSAGGESSVRESNSFINEERKRLFVEEERNDTEVYSHLHLREGCVELFFPGIPPPLDDYIGPGLSFFFWLNTRQPGKKKGRRSLAHSICVKEQQGDRYILRR